MLLDAVLHGAHWETEQVRVLRLRAPDARALPAFDCGAHVDVRLPGGEWRSYSLVNPPHDRNGYEIAVQRGPAPGARWLTDELQPGDRVALRAPVGGFPLVDDAAPVLLVAGGIGITPFLSMIDALQAQRRDWRLLYGVRSRAHAAFAARLRAHGERVGLHCDDEHGGRAMSLDGALAGCRAGTHVYACGPAPLMQEIERQRGLRPALRFHREATVHAAHAAAQLSPPSTPPSTPQWQAGAASPRMTAN